MSVQVKHRRESAAFLSSFVGAQGELIVDTTNNRVQVHDGVTPGGWPAAKLADIPTTSTLGAATAGVNSNITALTGLATPLSVNQGGTGASSAATARTSLGAAASGANSDITSLAAIASPLPAAGLPAFTGDVTSPAGSSVNTLATVNAAPGAVGSSIAIPVFTTNAKGLVTAQTTAAVVAPAGTLTGATLASNVTASALTSVGALTAGAVPTTLLTGTLQAAQAPVHTGDVTAAAGSLALTIAANVVTNAKAAQMAAGTLKGNNTGATANASDLTAAQAVAMLPAVVGDSGSGGTQGLVPAPPAGSAAINLVLGATGAFVGRLAGFRNRLRNANFAINQRALSGTVTLTAGAYGHDGVKGGASGATYTFATSGIDTVLTITAGSLILPIESTMIEGGVYAVSQAGTAQARVWQGTGSTGSGSYAVVPFSTSSLTAATQTNVEFSTGTVSRVQFEIGTVATAFERRPLSIETVTCERYFQQFGGTSTAEYFAAGVCGSSFAAFTIPTRVRMRAAPTLTIQNLADIAVYDGNANIVPSGVTYSNVTPDNLGFGLTCSGLTYGRGAILSAQFNTSALIQASSEL